MKTLITGVILFLSVTFSFAKSTELTDFLQEAKTRGVFAEKAALFLVAHMPPQDRTSLKKEFLIENLDLALKAREEFSWAKELPEEIFFNDVLPYASLDETRESWRPKFYEQCREIVKDSSSTSEAAQAINQNFFKLINVHYNKKRKAPNQSPSESQEIGKATCTGLSIILVDACRSVGVPARVAGTALWANKRGNHTWVEIYDSGTWAFTGADEYDKKGLNRGWFVKDASHAIADDWKHAIWATSWKATKNHFPMVWDLTNKNIPAVNITARYIKNKKESTGATANLRLWDKKGGQRIIATLSLGEQKVTTKAGTADLNDMASLKLPTGNSQQLSISYEGITRESTILLEAAGESTIDLYWDDLATHQSPISLWLKLLPEERNLSIPEAPLSRQDAEEASSLIARTLAQDSLEARKAELQARVIKAAGKEMKYLELQFGEAPADGRSLWISMHGGGGAPARVNDQQWNNQITLYEPEEGIVVAPRAPTNTWNLWHESHIDDLFDRLIGNMIALRGVNPNKVYLMGYSAGGDGVYQLAPRMADRFAAASMMAGHPNGVNPIGLRNLPFMIFMGGNDAAYQRNKIAAQWKEKLAALQKKDPKGYPHKVTLYEGLGHWMKRKDRAALPWMAKYQRETWPKKVIWHQSGRTHDRFYWLAVPPDSAKKGQDVIAEVTGQKIEIAAEGLEKIIVRLNDALLHLDQPITITLNGEVKFQGKVERKMKHLWHSLNERLDPASAASAIIELTF